MEFKISMFSFLEEKNNHSSHSINNSFGEFEKWKPIDMNTLKYRINEDKYAPKGQLTRCPLSTFQIIYFNIQA